MDDRTIAAYEANVDAIFRRFINHDRRREHERIQPFLIPGGLTADIGCGSGADLAWLNSIGLPAIGYEPTRGLRHRAQKRFVDLDIRADSLPELATISDGKFVNVLCSAVLMHVPPESLAAAVANLARIVAPGGRLIVSWRRGKDNAEREDDGRLFNPIEVDELAGHFAAAGVTQVETWTEPDQNRPGLEWTTWIGEKRHSG
ncbi:MAG: class I SAM-dependent methyltransferase [Chloroflexota bacterium]|nr:class I SAM-dependent methyltransferase [Chloroflexota bacterium]